MIKILLSFSLIVIGLQLHAQENPVTWSFDSKKEATGIYRVNITAVVLAPWHIYSQTTPAGGPIPTKIQFKQNPLLNYSGSISEQGQVQKHHDKNFGVDVIYFDGDVKFSQVVKVKTAVKTSLHGSIEYMVCNDSKCLPPVVVPFDITLN